MIKADSDNVGFGCAVLFLLPFCAVGVVTGVLAVQRILAGSPDLEETLLFLVFALVFGGVGFGLLYLAYRAKISLEKRQALEKRYPDTPWMWREDWAAGRITDSSKTEIVLAWSFALFVLLFSVPLVFAFRDEVLEKGNNLALLGLIFPIAGLGLLTWAIRATIRWKRFGVSTLQMTSLPGVVGGPVAGTIETGLRTIPENGFLITLRSIRRTRTRRGRSRSTHEKILWQEEQRIRREELFPGPRGTSTRFSFQVPFDCEPSSERDSASRVLWRLQAEAEVPGVDFSSTFEIPVFRTERSSTAPSPFVDLPQSVSPEEIQQARRTSKIRVRTTPTGGRDIYFPAARNPGMATGLTLFFLIWMGAILLMRHAEAPLFFQGIFGLFGVLIFIGVISMWFGTSRLRIEGGEVRLKNAILGMGETKVLSVDEIARVKTKIGTQHGGGSGTPYYDILLSRRTGRDLTVGRYIKNKREVEWLVGEIEGVLHSARMD
jgi:hypothetical protein